MPLTRSSVRFLLLLATLLPACHDAGTARAARPEVLVRRVDGVEFQATVARAGFERELFGMPGYHLIVWEGGKAAGGALFRAKVTDGAVLDAFEELGAEPGNALGMDSWEKRDDPSSTAPDQTIVGPAVEILVRIPGRQQPLSLGEILDDPGGKGFVMRLGGHRANIPIWRSGCLACLYSCPGSKVGNAAYTVRDYERGTTRFRVRPGLLPADGEEVTLVLRLLDPPRPGG